MDKIKFLLASLSLFLMIFAYGCGDDNEENPINSASLQGLGNINLSCNGQSRGQQKQIQFQQQQSCPQPFQFQQSKVSDFDVDLDCDSRVVRVQNKGIDDKQVNIPIQADGTVKGKMSFQQQMQSDGRNLVCWIEYVVDFDGKATCPSTGIGVSPEPSPTAGATMDLSSDALSLVTTVSLQQTNESRLEQAGISGASPTPSPSPTDDNDDNGAPGATPTPSPTVTGSPTPTPSPTGSPSASPTPTATPTPTRTPIVVCVVQNPCSVSGKSDLTCPKE